MRRNTLKTKSWYKWLVCFTATFIVFCSIGLTISSFAIYLPFIQEQNGFTATQTNMLQTLRAVFQLVGVFSIGKYYKMVSYRIGAALAMILLCAGFLLYGMASNYPMYCVAAIICGLSSGLSGTVGNLILTDWFDDNRGTAIGICAAGSGIASIVMPIAVTQLVSNFSLRISFFVEAGFVLLIGLVALAIIGENPNVIRAVNPMEAVQGVQTKSQHNFTISTKFVVILISSFFLMGFVITGITGALAQLLREDYPAETTSLLVTVFGIALFVGKIAYGRLSDKLGQFKINLITYGFLFVGTLGMFLVHDVIACVVIWVVCMGFGCPLPTVAMPLLTNENSAPGRYINALKICSLFTSGGGLVVSYVTGALADLTKGYASIFLVLALTAFLSALMVEFVTKTAKKRTGKVVLRTEAG